ncbi:porin [Parvibaculum sp.]|uniref:porin n=1 Tax=Parvibaculum sp. TaxID=2024848 RepID=UPI001B1AFF13|nr:porin [Parvibaculum sp.]MBO6635453.1 porin [Parvibaculum sp.]MBO6677437.1 porin [Parvibaculum sp.]MBO6686205.1 porin [Parvibaculum sp.]
MKKMLLGTTALISAGLIAGPVLASDPLTVTVGGTVTAGFYAIDHDDIGGTSFSETAVKLVARNIDINAEGTLDNGMVAGVTATLSLGDDWNYHVNNDATFRELFVYLEGGLGRFEIGGTDGAAFKMHYTSPWFVPGNGVDSPNILNVVAATAGVGFRNSTFSLMGADANKVTYFTPRFASFQLGLSYTPDTSYNGPNPNGLGVAVIGTSLHDVIEVAVNYSGTFGNVDVGADGFYVTGDGDNVFLPGTSSDPEEMGFGLNLGFGGFTLGGAWYNSEDLFTTSIPMPSLAGIEEEVWTAGVSYATGPWTVGVSYLEDEIEIGFVGASVDVNTWQAGGGYNLGSGVDIGLDVQKSDVDLPILGGISYDSTSAGLVLSVSF